jgi:hypothetical protein
MTREDWNKIHEEQEAKARSMLDSRGQDPKVPNIKNLGEMKDFVEKVKLRPYA